MTIWLGYPEEFGGSSTSSHDIESLIEELEAKDNEIDELQDQLVEELQKLDRDLKLREKQEFVEDAKLGHGVKRTSNNLGSTFDDIYQGKLKSILDDTASALLELDAKLKSLELAVTSERADNEPQNQPNAVTNSINFSKDRSEHNNGAFKKMQTLRIDTITNVITTNNRCLVEHLIQGRPGTSGSSSSLIQDLGIEPASIRFKGVLTSNSEDRIDLQKKVEILKWFFHQRKPLFFSSRLVNQLEATKVLIEALIFEEKSDTPYMVEFNCTLREYFSGGDLENSDAETGFKTDIKNWTEFQILNAALKYRTRFITDGDNITNSELSQKIARAVILDNQVIKNIIEI